jgi:hypothetical protein
MKVTGLPAGATGTFSPDPTTTNSSTLSVTTSKSGTITPVGTYPLVITGTGGGLAPTTAATLVVTDGIAPSVTPPKYRLYNPTGAGSTYTPVRVYWAASDPSGVASYQLQRQISGGTWTALTLSTPTATSVYPWLTYATTYRYRVMATDTAGNASAWVYGTSVEPLLTQQTSSAVTYTGTWTSATMSDALGGSLKYATAAGASATYSFNGSSVAWVAYLGSTRGSANVYVDGVFKATISLYSTTSVSKRIAYAYTWSANGNHTFKVVVVGTAGHPRVDVDAFVKLILL